MKFISTDEFDISQKSFQIIFLETEEHEYRWITSVCAVFPRLALIYSLQ